MTYIPKDGGPAFPTGGQTSMSMRDWFAGQALSGHLAFSPHDSFDKAHTFFDVAKVAYQFADAMLAERDKAGA